MTNPQDPYNSGGDNSGYGYPGGGQDNRAGNQGYPSYPGQDGAGHGAPGGGYQAYPDGAGQHPYGEQAYGQQGGYQAGYGGGYQTDGWDQPQARNGVAPWALGVSILGVVLTVTLFLALFAPLVGIVGLILGIIGVVKARKIQGKGRRMGMSVVSIILSVIAIIVPLVVMVVGFAFFADSGMADCLQLPADQQATCMNSVVEDMTGSQPSS